MLLLGNVIFIEPLGTLMEYLHDPLGTVMEHLKKPTSSNSFPLAPHELGLLSDTTEPLS